MYRRLHEAVPGILVKFAVGMVFAVKAELAVVSVAFLENPASMARALALAVLVVLTEKPCVMDCAAIMGNVATMGCVGVIMAGLE